MLNVQSGPAISYILIGNYSSAFKKCLSENLLSSGFKNMIIGLVLEMNIFIPQSIQTVIELEEIADVQKQMIVAKSSRTVIGIIQDGLIGAYNITHDSMKINWQVVMNILANTSFKDYHLIKKNKEYTGKEVYSFIIPPNINIDRHDITIKNSEIIKGRLTKAILGEGGKNNLIQSILDEHGSGAAKDFIDNTLKMLNSFNLYNGFTVGIGDLYVPPSVNKDIQTMFAKVDIALEHKITHAENNPDYMNVNMFESQIFSDLNIIRDNASKIIMENFGEFNKFKIMAISGSKGNATNIGQMAACAGLQTIGGILIKKRYNNRTLAYFHQYDDRPLSRGLIKNSFLLGESFSEFVFQMTAGREGIIDQVVRTSDTGYVQRKLIKMLEDVMVKYDGTVRSASNSLIQLVYGDSGADTTRQYEYKIKLLDMGNTELDHKFNSSENFFNKIKNLRDNVRKRLMTATLDTKTFNTSFMFPVNLLRIVSNTKETKIGNTPLTQEYVLEVLENLLYNENTPIIYIRKDQQKNTKSFKVRDDFSLKYLFELALYDALAPKILIDEYGLTKEMFDSIINKIKMAFNKNIVEPGEMIGIIAAQSMAEPLTQLNLNSVDWTEKILIQDRESGETDIIEIGKWIDELIQNSDGTVKHVGDNLENEMGDTYYLQTTDKNFMIPSVDEDGKVTWKKIEAVTKHLPINKDGTHTLLKVKTRLGKEVTATKAKSFLTRKDNKIVPMRGDELKVGTYLPVMKDFPETKWNNTVDTTQYFPKNKYVYGSEIEKARKIKADSNAKGSRLWFKDHIGTDYTVPYSRQDSLKCVLDGKRNKQVFKQDCIYPKKCKHVTSSFPEKMKLDRNFGFFCGSYMAEGHATENYVTIANNNDDYRNAVGEFAKQYTIGYHEPTKWDRMATEPGRDIRLHSTILAHYMKQICGHGSEHKYVPHFAYTASNEFVVGLLDGYFSGDGWINDCINASSISKEMLIGISTLLTRFGIVTGLKTPKRQTSNNIGTLPENIRQGYTLSIRNDFVKLFAKHVKLTIKYKQERLDKICQHDFNFSGGKYDIIPGNNIPYIKEQTNRREIINGLQNKNIKEKTILQKVVDSNVFYDEIISIEEVEPTHKYVYDLTVEDTKNFGLANALLVRDEKLSQNR
jgi:DNA-directed RNA polymerase beta' subunit